MFVQSLSGAPVNRRGDGQVSYLTLAPGQHESRNLTVTWVECAPASQQPLHSHAESEQVYVIVSGRGMMLVDGESREVGPGDTILIPPGSQHAIRNHTGEELVFVSAASPPWEPPSDQFAYSDPGAEAG
jgi:mannose-6-phosphate isomerase-like protein (cupin superfamily)